ncbi:nitroreductase [Halobacillus sp. BBL2006]|uniref:nitroreductase family protein n=1 Tax=Halobacillus sp. BBL2006 TaxID=1543706 RepID=UPI000542D9E6|nr:nitroreductase [Halobacillus sp. BBL2006]KHE72432.1 nitroreductase [Halobacillus sp. BBL2006]
MDLQEAVLNRRSIHDFKEDNVEQSTLKEVFAKSSLAPTHRMKQPWNILMFQDNGKEDYADSVLESYEREGFFSSSDWERAEKMKTGIRKFLVQIPHHALVYMEKDKDAHKYEEDYAAVCAFIQNAQLLAWEKGIGVLWMTSPYLDDPLFADAIGLDPSLHKLVAVLQMGYPRQIPKAKPRVPIDEKYELRSNHFKKYSIKEKS